MVLGSSDASLNHPNAGMPVSSNKHLSSIHQLDKSLLTRIPSTSFKQKLGATGVIIKERPTSKIVPHDYPYLECERA